MLDQWDDHYAELTYNGLKPRKIDWLAGTLRRAFWWPVAWLPQSPWREVGRDKWFIEGEKRWFN